MNKRLLTEVTAKFEVGEIESHLIYHFLESREINYQKSPILKKYFSGFKVNEPLYLDISTLDIEKINDLEKYLEVLIPPKDRKLNGAFFTPTYIVNFIVQSVSPQIDSKCLDPSCGCGAFLLGFVDYLKSKYRKNIKEIVRENLYGIDILEYNIRRAKLILTIFALVNNEILNDSDFNLSVKDSLRMDWKDHFKNNPDGSFDIIAGNPPYVKFQDLSNENRDFLNRDWEAIDNGTFNLYFAFFELGYNLLNQSGSLGYITPNNYFTSLAGKSLRRYLVKNKMVTRIIDFSHRKVFDAQTYTAITFLNKNKNRTIYYDRIGQKETPKKFLRDVNGSPNKINELKLKKWRLLKSDEQENIKKIETNGTPLKRLVNISVGIATLKDELYFLDSSKIQDGFFIKSIGDKNYRIEPGITRQIYKISDFSCQEDVFKNTRHIIFPYKVISGNALPINENELNEKFPECSKYFKSIREKLDARSKGKINVNPFYAFGRSQGLTKTGRKLLTPTFSKQPRFLRGNDEKAMFCNGYGIHFEDKHAETGSLFDNDIHALSKAENIGLLQKVLNSRVMDYYVTKTSVSIQGGYPCYQKNFIGNFTIPTFSDNELRTLSSLNMPQEIDDFLISKYDLKIQEPNLV